MEKKIKLPIKYAVLELKTKGGYLQNYEDITVGFIVSKCYVIEQNIRYLQDGTSEISYKVVFPCKNFDNYKYCLLRGIEPHEREFIPEYNFYGVCTNADTVSDIFDTYEDANETAIQENQNKKRTIFVKLVDYCNVLKEFNENLAICHSYEQLISEKTKEMTITSKDISIKKLSLTRPNNK